MQKIPSTRFARSRKAVGLATLILCATAGALAAADDGALKLEDGTVIPAPYAGFTWRKIQQTEGAVPMRIYQASAAGVAGKVLLIVEGATADTDAQRIAHIKAEYNGMAATLHNGGYTELKGSKPMLDPPLADRAEFMIEGKDKDGDARVFRSVLVFGKSVYHFQIVATTEEDAATLVKIAAAVQGSGPTTRP